MTIEFNNEPMLRVIETSVFASINKAPNIYKYSQKSHEKSTNKTERNK